MKGNIITPECVSIPGCSTYVNTYDSLADILIHSARRRRVTTSEFSIETSVLQGNLTQKAASMSSPSAACPLVPHLCHLHQVTLSRRKPERIWDEFWCSSTWGHRDGNRCSGELISYQCNISFCSRQIFVTFNFIINLK